LVEWLANACLDLLGRFGIKRSGPLMMEALLEQVRGQE